MDEHERNITDEELQAVKQLLFGSTLELSKAWTHGLQFEPARYALKQKLSGPCGLIASVEAFVIYELLFGDEREILKDGLLRPPYPKKKQALAYAISGILWRAKSGNHVVIARKKSLTTDSDEEQIKLRNITDYSVLKEHIWENVRWFMEMGGFISFMYSLVLTRGVDTIKQDMDDPKNTLIGEVDSYCTQEIINLILTGEAVTNIFDGEMSIGEGDEKVILKGITRRPKIGFLASTAGHSDVGDFYRNPERPIWVLYGNNHYFVVFGTTTSVVLNEEFDLFYVNSLDPRKEICLHIKPRSDPNDSDSSNSESTNSDVEELPSTIQCILTRWPNASIKLEVILN